MGMNFKAQVERDLTRIFHNSAEMADDLEFWIDGTRYKGPVIFNKGGVKGREKPSTDHADGISRVEAVLYAPLSLLKKIPKEGLPVEFGDTIYTITATDVEAGEVIMYLGAYIE